MTTARASAFFGLARPAAYIALTKPDVSFLVVLTAAAGYLMGSRGPVDYPRLLLVLLATVLLAAGTSALNHYFERDVDAQMRRTAGRPLPSGELMPGEALAFGLGLILAGAASLAVWAGPLPSLFGILTSVSYLALYTPLKKRTTLATFVGAFPGAAPPVIGWVAARGSLSLEVLTLYAILFFWQFPHFHAIAWMYREDYTRAGIRMLPVVDRTGEATFRQILVAAIALVPVSMLPAVMGMAGARYLFSALVLGGALAQVGIWAARMRSNIRAKWLMHATVAYLPLLLGMMVLDKTSR